MFERIVVTLGIYIIAAMFGLFILTLIPEPIWWHGFVIGGVATVLALYFSNKILTSD